MPKYQQKSYHLFYFFLQPFLTLLYYLKNFRKPHAKNVMWLFVVFYGSTFAVGAESQGADIVRYMAEVRRLHLLNLDFNGLLNYYLNSREFDFLRIILAYGVAYFTDNGFYLTIIYGIIYGYFFSRNMWYILDRVEGKIKTFTGIMLICMFLVIPIWNLGGFRFWVASHMFLFGLLHFLFERKRKSLIWCLVTPFIVHFSFLIALIPLAIYFLLGNRIKLYYIFFIITLFVSEFNITQFNDVIDTYGNEKLINKSRAYTDEEKVEDLRAGNQEKHAVWYANFYGLSLKYTMITFLIFFYWVFRKSVKSNKELLRLLSFILLFYGFANLLSSIPSGGRFLALANLLALSFIILYLQNNIVPKELYRLSKISTPFLIFFIIISIRISMYNLSVMTIMGNPFTAFITFGDNISLNDVLKDL